MLTQELLDTIERDAPATPARGLRLHRAMLKAELARPHTPALRAATTALLLKLEHLELEQERKRLVGEAEAARDATHEDTVTLGHEIRALRQEIHELRAGLALPACSPRPKKD